MNLHLDDLKSQLEAKKEKYRLLKADNKQLHLVEQKDSTKNQIIEDLEKQRKISDQKI